MPPVTLTERASHALGQWTKMPYGSPAATMECEDLRTLLLHTGGTVFISWTTYDVRSCLLAAGVYRVWLEPKPRPRI